MSRVLITGASGGLGEALVKTFATKENELLLVARNEQKLETLVKMYQHTCQKIAYCVADLSDEASYKKVVAFVENDVDIMIHNAGYGNFKYAEEFSTEDIEHIFKVNVNAPLQLTTKLLPQFYKRKSGHIIFVASQASKLVTPKSSLYSSTKFALRGYANGLRIEAKKHGVHVMCVNPGPIDTGFFDIADQTGEYGESVAKMMLTADDVAQAILKGVQRKKREINLPTWMEIGARFAALCPTLADVMIAKFGDKK
ncbi:SDR family oxidoreductase [Carnobacteriaceae bacterium zg-ZUI252]|nr:SDR family oxidoreductase [Carnobacteriaceae bacterium zg-ZUI252]